MSHERIPDADLLRDLRRVADEMGRPPTMAQYNERGNFNRSTLRRRFDGWTAALREADLDPDARDWDNPLQDPDGGRRADHSDKAWQTRRDQRLRELGFLDDEGGDA